MPTFFFRKAEHSMAPPILELPRLVSATIHLSIPVISYLILYNNWGHAYLSTYVMASVNELAPERKRLYMALDIFYSIRWATGMMTMMSHVNLPLGMFVALKHLIADEMGYILGSMAFRPGALTARDILAASLMVLAGILQHGSELQRWRFKRNPKNIGKLHTGGLFSLARGINHTGHVLRDLAHMIMVPYWPLMILYLFADYDLIFQIVPETMQHMREKYGEQYRKYEAQTPSIFIPGMW